jgi:ectoine hydroxylase-related dioxygenase (phytanoyl-CoA dioxygenase family)
MAPKLRAASDAREDLEIAARDAARFREQGVLRLDKLVRGSVLQALQTAFKREQQPARQRWQAAREAGPEGPESWHAQGYFDIPNVLESDPAAYMSLLCEPRLNALLRATVGEQVTLIHAQARTVPPEVEGGDYYGLHRDSGRSASGHSSPPPAHPTHSEHVKLFVALNEHSRSSGATAVVAGTHRSQERPPEGRAVTHPAMAVFDAQPGDALLMDLRTLHGALPNPGPAEREGLILMFGLFHRKAAGPVAVSAARLQAAGALEGAPPIVNQLLGFSLAPPPLVPAALPPPPLPPPLGAWKAPPSPTVAEFEAAESDTEEQLRFFRAHGFLRLRGAVRGAELAELQEAWGRHEPPVQEAWREAAERGRGVSSADPLQYGVGDGYRKFYQMDGVALVEAEPAVRHVLSHAAWLGLVEQLVGEDMQVTHVQPRTVPADDGEGGYVTWHRDAESPPWQHPTLAPHGLKVFLAINDHGRSDGPSAVVPGSQLCAEEPRAIATFAGSGGEGVPQREMPGLFEFTAQAGDAMLMDLRTYHTALPNVGARDRRTLILMYAPFWRKSGLESAARALLARGVELTDVERQLLALEQRGGAGNIFDPRWLEKNPRPDIR